MGATPLLIERTGLVTSVGLTARTACAAIRAKVANPSITRFLGADGDFLSGHEVELAKPWLGLAKLANMAALAIEECLGDLTPKDCEKIPLLLCVAEPERPGRLDGLDEQVFKQVTALLDRRFAEGSAVIPHGRAGTAVALHRARQLVAAGQASQVVIAGTDTFLHWPTLQAYGEARRLLTETNSNGFMPGEAAGAVLITADRSCKGLACTGIGFGVEAATVLSEEPLRADGLSTAVKQALQDASHAMHELDFRICDLSGEQYYFKEAALTLSRTMRQRKEFFDIWHPAECIGETGAAAGLAMLAVLDMSLRKGYAPGPKMLAHFSNDAGQRAALVLQASA